MTLDKIRFIGIDVGTESLKAIGMSSGGRVIAEASSVYNFTVPHPGFAQQNPETWWKACLAAFADLQEKAPLSAVECIGITGQMHSAVFLDKSGEILCDALLWNDQRSSDEARELQRIVGQAELKDITGNRMMPGFTASKIQWVKNHRPEVFRAIGHVIMPKDYILYRLTGDISTDVTDASGTLLFNVAGRQWATDLIHEFGFQTEWFPFASESQSVVGRITKEASLHTGIRTGTPVIAGAADNAAAAVGVGVVDNEHGMISIGTSGVALAATNDPSGFHLSSGQLSSLHNFCHAIPGMWYSMGVTLSAGGSLRWFRDALAVDLPDQSLSYDFLSEMAAAVSHGSDGLIFLPYLAGERTPHISSTARGVLFGLNLQHSVKHFVRAIMEGVSYSIVDCLELLRQVCPVPRRLHLTGGIVKSPTWGQIMADVTGYQLAAPIHEGAAQGAAFLAGMASGAFHTDVVKQQEIKKAYEPDETHHASYQQLYVKYRGLYKALERQF